MGVFMKRLSIAPLGAFFATSAVSVVPVCAAGSLWNLDVDCYEIQVPSLPTCDDELYEKTGFCSEKGDGGWWFPYMSVAAEGQSVSLQPSGANPDGSLKLQIVNNRKDCSVVPDGNIVKDKGLVVTMSAAGGSASDPVIAGIRYLWQNGGEPIDISSHSGYCLAYSWTGSTPLQLELGWKDENGKNTWYAELPSQSSSKAINLPWSQFKQDGYSKKDISEALSQAVSLNIRLKSTSEAEVEGTLTLVDLGWEGECQGASEGTEKFMPAVSTNVSNSNATAHVYSVLGTYLGSVELAHGISVNEAVRGKVQHAGVYLVRQGSITQKVQVK